MRANFSSIIIIPQIPQNYKTCISKFSVVSFDTRTQFSIKNIEEETGMFFNELEHVLF